jgi:Flp pilus assembly protein TadG
MKVRTMISLASGRRRRRGTTVVEAAMVLPIFFIFIFAIIAFGHSQLVANVLDAACRKAARYGSNTGVTTAEVRTQVENLVRTVADTNDVTIIIKDARVYDTGGTLPSSSEGFSALPDVEVADLEPRDLFLVRVEMQYSDVALISLPFLESLENAVIVGEAFTRHE